MNINNILCRKIVTMDITERCREATGSKFLAFLNVCVFADAHELPFYICVCLFTPASKTEHI